MSVTKDKARKKEGWLSKIKYKVSYTIDKFYNMNNSRLGMDWIVCGLGSTCRIVGWTSGRREANILNIHLDRSSVRGFHQ